MKQTLLALLFSIFIAQISFAQEATPNAGFENWTLKYNSFYTPDDWDNLNLLTSILGSLTCIRTTEAHTGSYACKLITLKLSVGDTANGIITTGQLITVPPYGVKDGIPYTLRPDSIYGWIKYAPVGGDSTQIVFVLLSAAHDTIGKAEYKAGQTLTAYTRFSNPINYFSAENPDSSLWLISSSNGFDAQPNSTMWIDDIGLAFTVGINELSLHDFIFVSPNPANDILYIKNEEHLIGDLVLLDEQGKIIDQFHLNGQSTSIDISKLAEGIYILKVTDEKQNSIATGKILIQH
ncbi:MAG: T9SS type A sorting domain-containing protein [Chitinophagales bacterium]|nr:T9SS type A sorting domain-containing protein [Chitinophagales bacterium]